jgi:hypothetical protein
MATAWAATARFPLMRVEIPPRRVVCDSAQIPTGVLMAAVARGLAVRNSQQPLRTLFDLAGDFHEGIRGKVIRLLNPRPSDKYGDRRGTYMEGSHRNSGARPAI